MGLLTDILDDFHRETNGLPLSKRREYLADRKKAIAKMREVVEGIKNPYFVIDRWGTDPPTTSNIYPEFQIFEEARQAILKAMED